MKPSITPRLRQLHLYPPFPSPIQMAPVIPRVAQPSLFLTSSITSNPFRSSSRLGFVFSASRFYGASASRFSPLLGWRFHALAGLDGRVWRGPGMIWSEQRDYRKVRRAKPKNNDNELELSVSICIEEALPDDPDVLSITEMLRLNAPMALKLAFDGLKNSGYKTRDFSIGDLGGFDSVELSVLLCNDDFIRKLNKEWRDVDHATDVLSLSQHVPGLKLPILMLGDIVISVETAARQAEERGHDLLDEIRILLVHGLLHLLGFDHEISVEAEAEMEREEGNLLKSLGWKGKGLIHSTYDTNSECINSHTEIQMTGRKKEGSLRFYRPKFSYIFCDMDGTLLNSRSQISLTTVKAVKEALSRGIRVVVATGKCRPAAISVLKTVGLAGKDGILSEATPGVFLQGLLVYGRQGREISRRSLDPTICREACLYSWEKKVPLVAFSGDRCLTLFENERVDLLHTIYHEPKAEVVSSVEQLLATVDIQKVILLATPEEVTNTIRPYWSEAAVDRASVIQAVPEVLEIVSSGTSKGGGVKELLDHLGITSDKIMAIGDGENDVEMLELASLGIALSNGSEKAKAVANWIGLSNDEDGVADAIYRHAF